MTPGLLRTDKENVPIDKGHIEVKCLGCNTDLEVTGRSGTQKLKQKSNPSKNPKTSSEPFQSASRLQSERPEPGQGLTIFCPRQV